MRPQSGERPLRHGSFAIAARRCVASDIGAGFRPAFLDNAVAANEPVLADDLPSAILVHLVYALAGDFEVAIAGAVVDYDVRDFDHDEAFPSATAERSSLDWVWKKRMKSYNLR